jgi:hypothetical protein
MTRTVAGLASEAIIPAVSALHDSFSSLVPTVNPSRFVLAISVDCSMAGGIAGHGGYVLFLCHAPTFFRALVTGFRTLLTMLMFMFGAFITARLTNLSA